MTRSASRRHSSCRDRSAGMARTSPNRTLFLRLSARFCLAGADHHADAGLEQSAGDHHPDASGAAGDERGFAAQVEKFCMRCGLAVRHWVAFHRRLERSWASSSPRDWLPAYVGKWNHLAVLMRSAPIVIPRQVGEVPSQGARP